jgi:hypothetical protein
MSAPAPAADTSSRVGELARRYHAVLLALVVLVFIGLSCRSASRKLLYYDELFAVYLSRHAGPGELWRNLLTSREPNPPLVYLAIPCSVALLGETQLAVRVPAILAFAPLIVCLYAFALRHGGLACAWITVLVLLASNVSAYAFEARAYAFVLGFGALAILCWQRGTESSAALRTLWLLGMAASLALALSSHYYAVLLFVPLAVGEAVRTLVKRKIDWGVWFAMGLGGSILLLYRPLIAAAKQFATGFWARPGWSDVELNYGTFFVSLATPLMATLVVLAWCAAQRPRSDEPQRSLPLHELALAAGFLLVPIVGIFLGIYVTGAFTKRYALPTSIGACLLLGHLVQRVVAGRALPLGLLLALFAGWSVVGSEFRYRKLAEAHAELQEACNFLDRHCPSGEKVILGNSFTYLQTTYYRGCTKVHPVYLTSATVPLRYHRSNTDELGLLGLAPVAGLDVIDLDDFRPSESFLLFGRESWLHTELKKRGFRFHLLAECSQGKLYRVTPQ